MKIKIASNKSVPYTFRLTVYQKGGKYMSVLMNPSDRFYNTFFVFDSIVAKANCYQRNQYSGKVSFKNYVDTL